MPFSSVLTRELNEITAARLSRDPDSAVVIVPPADPSRRADEMKLVGLAFSGGGTRSATFNLGVIQALAGLGLLRRFDLLSTVSGGGYIGGWLAACIKRHPAGVQAVEGDLGGRETWPVTFLRQYSNYLTPQLGFFSADTWTLVTTWVRNTLLNQSVQSCSWPRPCSSLMSCSAFRYGDRAGGTPSSGWCWPRMRCWLFRCSRGSRCAISSANRWRQDRAGALRRECSSGSLFPRFWRESSRPGSSRPGSGPPRRPGRCRDLPDLLRHVRRGIGADPMDRRLRSLLSGRVQGWQCRIVLLLALVVLVCAVLGAAVLMLGMRPFAHDWFRQEFKPWAFSSSARRS